MSVPAIKVSAVWSIPTESKSNTPLACGWSPTLVWSPVSANRLFIPNTPADNISPCIAILFLSLPVIWITGSNPASFNNLHVAREVALITADWKSVTFAAWTLPTNGFAHSIKCERSVPFGGAISVVTANFPLSNVSLNKLISNPPFNLLKKTFMNLLLLLSFSLHLNFLDYFA